MCNPILQASLSLLKNFAMELLLQSSFTELVEEFCNGASSAIKLH
jgi:hypothetical protein